MERPPKFETPPEPAPKPEKAKTPFQEVMDAEEQWQEERQRSREQLTAQNAQESVVKNIVDYLKGESSFRRSDLSEEERGLLERMSAEVRRNMRENPRASAVNLDFSKNPDAYRIWSGLVNRMTKERLALPIPEQKEAEAPKPIDPQEAKGAQILGAFGAMAESAKEAAQAKLKEYDERIRAALDGRPLKPEDTVEQLRRDYRMFARKDWEPTNTPESQKEK